MASRILKDLEIGFFIYVLKMYYPDKLFYNKFRNEIDHYYLENEPKEWIEITPKNYEEISKQFVARYREIDLFQNKAKNTLDPICEYIYYRNEDFFSKYYRKLSSEEKEEYIRSLGDDPISKHIEIMRI